MFLKMAELLYGIACNSKQIIQDLGKTHIHNNIVVVATSNTPSDTHPINVVAVHSTTTAITTAGETFLCGLFSKFIHVYKHCLYLESLYVYQFIYFWILSAFTSLFTCLWVFTLEVFGYFFLCFFTFNFHLACSIYGYQSSLFWAHLRVFSIQ